MKILLLLLSCFINASVFAGGENTFNDKLYIESKLLNEKIEIYVTLPDIYFENGYQFPVMYYLDAKQNFKHIAGALDVLNRTGSVPPMITVGIEIADRDNNFKPLLNDNKTTIDGGSERFHLFITDELMPEIESRYRSNKFNILQGHSLGGLFVGYSMLHHPEDFDGYILISPAFWWNNNWMISLANQYYKKNPEFKKRAFFAIGSDDGQGMQNELKAFYDTLPQSAKSSNTVKHVVLPNEGHMSAPLLGNYYALIHIFDNMHYNKARWDSFTSDDFDKHETFVVKHFGQAAKQTEENYSFLGNHLLFRQNYVGAITVYEYLVKHYPLNHYGYQALAQAYYLNNQNASAISAYREAYRLSTEQKSGSFEPQQYLYNIELLEKPLSLGELADYEGEYQSPNTKIVITRDGNRLKGYVEGLGSFDLFPEAEHTYRIKLIWAAIIFVQDESGKTVKMIIDQGNKEEALKISTP